GAHAAAVVLVASLREGPPAAEPDGGGPSSHAAAVGTGAAGDHRPAASADGRRGEAAARRPPFPVACNRCPAGVSAHDVLGTASAFLPPCGVAPRRVGHGARRGRAGVPAVQVERLVGGAATRAIVEGSDNSDSQTPWLCPG